MSGTTAITVMIRGRSILVANVGDSRAVLAEKRADGTGYLAKDLSIDQTPYRYVCEAVVCCVRAWRVEGRLYGIRAWVGIRLGATHQTTML